MAIDDEVGEVEHPGRALSEWMVRHAVSGRELAGQLGVSYKHLSRIRNGKAGYSLDLAVKLAAATGMPREFWWSRMTAWQLHERHPGP